MDTAPTPDVRNPQAEMPQVHAASLNRRLAVAVAVLTVAVAGLGAALIVEFGSEQAPRAGETPAQAYRGRSHVYA